MCWSTASRIASPVFGTEAVVGALVTGFVVFFGAVVVFRGIGAFVEVAEGMGAVGEAMGGGDSEAGAVVCSAAVGFVAVAAACRLKPTTVNPVPITTAVAPATIV
jgi:hypothetical protein